MTSRQQRGMTMWGTAFVIGVVVFFLFLFFKLLPPYLEDLKVRTAINGLAAESGAGEMPKKALVESLRKRFDIDNVTNVVADQLTIDSRGKSKLLHIQYEVVVPLAYNVSALLEFDHASPVAATQ
jgi:Domain of unknown function (DUF4845)